MTQGTCGERPGRSRFTLSWRKTFMTVLSPSLCPKCGYACRQVSARFLSVFHYGWWSLRLDGGCLGPCVWFSLQCLSVCFRMLSSWFRLCWSTYECCFLAGCFSLAEFRVSWALGWLNYRHFACKLRNSLAVQRSNCPIFFPVHWADWSFADILRWSVPFSSTA